MLTERLKHLRSSKNLLQKDVANKLGISASAYGFYEQGKREPDAKTIKKIADLYDVSTDYLLGRDEKKYSGILTKNNSNPEIAMLLKDNKIELLTLARDLTYEELKIAIEFANNLKKQKTGRD